MGMMMSMRGVKPRNLPYPPSINPSKIRSIQHPTMKPIPQAFTYLGRFLLFEPQTTRQSANPE